MLIIPHLHDNKFILVFNISGLIVSPGNESKNIPRASRNMLLKEIDIRTLLDGFSERKCNIFDSEKLSQIKTKKERTYRFIEILQGNNEYFDVLLEVLEQENKMFVLKMLKLWRQVYLKGKITFNHYYVIP